MRALAPLNSAGIFLVILFGQPRFPRIPPHHAHAADLTFLRLFVRSTLFIFAFFLVGCGQNADRGIAYKERNYMLSTSSQAAGVTQGLSYGPCKNLQLYGPADSTLNGSSACASTSQLNVVMLRVNAYFPSNVRYCLVPFSSSASFPETCFTMNGQANITLSTSSFSGVSLVKESDLAYYKSYLTQPLTPPSFAYALLR